MVKPSPDDEANISEITIRISPIDSALADPGEDLRARPRAAPRSAAARSQRSRTYGPCRRAPGRGRGRPRSVFSSTGQIAPETITTTFIVSLTPISSISTGTSTGGGIARKNSNSGSV